MTVLMIVAIICLILAIIQYLIVFAYKPIKKKQTHTFVKKSPDWFDWFAPLLDTQLAHALYPFIWLPPTQYVDYTSWDPSVRVQSVVVHECMHLERQEMMTPLWFGMRYLCSSSFRLQEELIAISTQMNYLQQHGENYPLAWKAKQFAGREYGYMMTETEAMKILHDCWIRISDST